MRRWAPPVVQRGWRRTTSQILAARRGGASRIPRFAAMAANPVYRRQVSRRLPACMDRGSRQRDACATRLRICRPGRLTGLPGLPAAAGGFPHGLVVGAALRRDGLSESRRKAAPTVCLQCLGASPEEFCYREPLKVRAFPGFLRTTGRDSSDMSEREQGRRGAVLLRPFRKGATRSRPYQGTSVPAPVRERPGGGQAARSPCRMDSQSARTRRSPRSRFSAASRNWRTRSFETPSSAAISSSVASSR